MIKMKRKLGIICLLVFAFCIPFVLGACGGNGGNGGGGTPTINLSDYDLEWMQDDFDRLDNMIDEDSSATYHYILWKPTLTAAEIDELLSDIETQVLQSEMQLYRLDNSGSDPYLYSEKYTSFRSNDIYIDLDFYFLHSDGKVYNVNFYYSNNKYPQKKHRGEITLHISLCDYEIAEA